MKLTISIVIIVHTTKFVTITILFSYKCTSIADTWFFFYAGDKVSGHEHTILVSESMSHIGWLWYCAPSATKLTSTCMGNHYSGRSGASTCGKRWSLIGGPSPSSSSRGQESCRGYSCIWPWGQTGSGVALSAGSNGGRVGFWGGWLESLHGAFSHTRFDGDSVVCVGHGWCEGVTLRVGVLLNPICSPGSVLEDMIY